MAHTIYATRHQVKERTCYNPVALQKLSKRYCKRTYIFYDPQQALQVALKNAEIQDAVVVTGSFFMVGELRTIWYPEECILRKMKSF